MPRLLILGTLAALLLVALGPATAEAKDRPGFRLAFHLEPWEDDRVAAIARAQLERLRRYELKLVERRTVMFTGGGVAVGAGVGVTIPAVLFISQLEGPEWTGGLGDILIGAGAVVIGLAAALAVLGAVALYAVGAVLIIGAELQMKKIKAARKARRAFEKRIAEPAAALARPVWGPPIAAARRMPRELAPGLGRI